MHTLKYLIVLLGLIYHTYSAESNNNICILDNVNCVTKGGSKVYMNVVNGVKHLLVPLDPLHMEAIIEGEIEEVQYKLKNITFQGFKNCTVTKLELNATSGKWKQYLHCPRLLTHFNFQAKKDTEKPVLRGKGMAYLVAQNYDILNYGKYSVFVNEDHRPHFYIISQNSKTTSVEKLSFNITMSNLDEEKEDETVKYMNHHWKQTEKFLHRIIVDKTTTILADKIDIYYKKYTMAEVLPATK